MANEDIIKQRGTFKIFKDDRGGGVLYSHPIIGIVKNNIDPLRSGKIQVYLDRLNAADQDNPENWTWVNYSSPFFGYTQNTASNDADGTFVGNRNSYGFWATPPDINTEVICVFINGQPDLGYYIASIPSPTLNHMVPAIGASSNIIPNEGEANSYGGATALPVTEINDANQTYENSDQPQSLARPIHSYQAAILNNQGLLRDPVRGAISSSAMRESPSKVFGISTPGNPIYAGGFNAPGSKTISEAVRDQTISDEQFAVIGRTGGHTFVLDDGDIDGKNKLVRLRTAQGHTLLMNDTDQTLFIIHSNGKSWIELGKEGTIDMYSTNSVNVRTQGDLNLHADNNININAKKDLNISADNINIESLKATNQFVGTEYKGFTKGSHTLKVNSKMSFYSKDDSSIKSDRTNYLNGGPNVHLNTGASSLVPEEVKQLPIVAHVDTLYDEQKGYASAPAKLKSIVSRAPTHQPWANANQGVDVKVNLSASANFPAAASENIQQINQSVSSLPVNATSPSVMATVPNLNPVSSPLDQMTATSLVSQMAVNASTGTSSMAVKSTAGVVNIDGQKVASIGSLALTPAQLEEAGYLKPGSAVSVNAAISNGKSIADAMPPNVFTGKNGVASVSDLTTSISAQAYAATDLMRVSEGKLISAGAITGKESSTQIGGLVLSTASVGITPTLDLLKQSTVGASVVNGSYLSASVNSPSQLVAGGVAATTLADKQNSGLGASLSKIGTAVKGAAAAVWEKITSAFKKLVPNKPQNLKAEEAKQVTSENNTRSDALGAVQNNKSNFVDNVKNNISNLTLQQAGAGLGIASTLVGGRSASTLLNTAVGLSIAGNLIDSKGTKTTLGSLTTKVKNIASNLFRGKKSSESEIAKLSADVTTSGGTLNSYATAQLSAEDVAKLQNELAASGTSGALDIKAPTTAINTFDDAGVQRQTTQLLGNPKIPNPLA